jgi:epoxide hydrolase A/B
MTPMSSTETDVDLTHRMLDVHDGQRIHLAERGDGPLVLLVHGFPDTWRSWRHQLQGAGGRRV